MKADTFLAAEKAIDEWKQLQHQIDRAEKELATFRHIDKSGNKWHKFDFNLTAEIPATPEERLYYSAASLSLSDANYPALFAMMARSMATIIEAALISSLAKLKDRQARVTLPVEEVI